MSCQAVITRLELQSSPLSLLLLDGDEEGLEIAFPEAKSTTSLNYLEEQCGSIREWLGEDLEEISLVIPIN